MYFYFVLVMFFFTYFAFTLLFEWLVVGESWNPVKLSTGEDCKVTGQTGGIGTPDVGV